MSHLVLIGCFCLVLCSLQQPFRDAFNNESVRRRFGFRTFFILGTDERTASMNEIVETMQSDDVDDSSQLHTANSAPESTLERLKVSQHRLVNNPAFRILQGVQPAIDQLTQLDVELRQESQLYGDILQASFVDSYANLTVKVLTAAKWIASRCSQARFAMKIDTDTIPNLPSLFASLIERDLTSSNGAALDYLSFYSLPDAEATEKAVRQYFQLFLQQHGNYNQNDSTCLTSSSMWTTAKAKQSTSKPVNSAELESGSFILHYDESLSQSASSTETQRQTSHSDLQCARKQSEFYMTFNSPMMVGYRYGSSSVRRRGRWAVSWDNFPLTYYPEYLAGTAYVLSSSAVYEVYFTALHYRYFFGIEDAFVTGVLGTLIRARKYADSRFSPYNSWQPSVCQLLRGDRLTATNFNPTELVDFWNAMTRNQLTC